jgi:antitoxin (DNA-binding transcriptional repressor) of toxin-antitoxin stability system
MSMKTKSVDIQEAQTKLKELVSLASQGTQVFLLEGSQPVARIVSLDRIPGLHPGEITSGDDFDEPLPEDFWTGKP